jgi:hypothetical protein
MRSRTCEDLASWYSDIGRHQELVERAVVPVFFEVDRTCNFLVLLVVGYVEGLLWENFVKVLLYKYLVKKLPE